MTTTDGLRTGLDALLSPGGPGAKLTAAELRRALGDLYEFELIDRSSQVGIGLDSGFALIAFGGLGRKEILPHSDLDLVLVHDSQSIDRVSEVADSLWYPLWDAGVRLDHSVRTVDQCLSVASGDLTVALGLLDARVVAGDTELGALVVDGARRQWRQQIPGRFDELVTEAEARRRRAGLIAHRMEPDLKNGEGGLRDIQLLSALAAAHLTNGVPDPIPGAPGAGFDAAHRLVLDARTELHRITGRGRDVLYAQYGDDIARALGIGDRFDLARALSDSARTIAHATDVGVLTARSAVPQRGLPRLLRRSVARRPLDEGVVEHSGQVVLARGARVDRDPGILLRIAAAAARSGLPISAATLRKLADECPEFSHPWPEDALSDLLTLLGSGEAQIPVIESLDRSGLWGRLFPEWGAVRDLPARDQAHAFTVDRHLVQCAVEASRLTTSVQRADLLLIAALIHDLGKGRDRDHSEVGAELAEAIGARIGLDTDDVETLSRTIRHHLILAVTASRRDPLDPGTGDYVLDLLDHDGRALDVLAALTEADSRATGPSVWGEWKERVHSELVATCREQARVTTSDIDEPPVVSSGRSRAGESLVELSPTVMSNTHEIVCDFPLPNKKGASASPVAVVATVLAAHGLEIIKAEISVDPVSTTARSTATDSEPRIRSRMLVATSFGAPAEVSLLRQDLIRSLAGGVPKALHSTLDRRMNAAPACAQAPATVRLRNRQDSPGTLVEVRTEDRPGLLGRIAYGLAESGAYIDWARVRTRGAAVEDLIAISGSGASNPDLTKTLEALLPPVCAPDIAH